MHIGYLHITSTKPALSHRYLAGSQVNLWCQTLLKLLTRANHRSSRHQLIVLIYSSTSNFWVKYYVKIVCLFENWKIEKLKNLISELLYKRFLDFSFTETPYYKENFSKWFSSSKNNIRKTCPCREKGKYLELFWWVKTK